MSHCLSGLCTKITEVSDARSALLAGDLSKLNDEIESNKQAADQLNSLKNELSQTKLKLSNVENELTHTKTSHSRDISSLKRQHASEIEHKSTQICTLLNDIQAVTNQLAIYSRNKEEHSGLKEEYEKLSSNYESLSKKFRKTREVLELEIAKLRSEKFELSQKYDSVKKSESNRRKRLSNLETKYTIQMNEMSEIQKAHEEKLSKKSEEMCILRDKIRNLKAKVQLTRKRQHMTFEFPECDGGESSHMNHVIREIDKLKDSVNHMD